jgi:hypothetical protein
MRTNARSDDARSPDCWESDDWWCFHWREVRESIGMTAAIIIHITRSVEIQITALFWVVLAAAALWGAYVMLRRRHR